VEEDAQANNSEAETTAKKEEDAKANECEDENKIGTNHQRGDKA
jgi:hypothetical protein